MTATQLAHLSARAWAEARRLYDAFVKSEQGNGIAYLEWPDLPNAGKPPWYALALESLSKKS